MTIYEILIALALSVGYKPSKWTKHQGLTCPECGKKLIVFYHIERKNPRMAACPCGYRQVEGRKAVNINRDGITTWAARTKAAKVKPKVVRCQGITKKGRRCKKIATHGHYCKFHAHQG